MISGINYNKLCQLGGPLGHLSAIFDDFTMYHVCIWWTCWDMDMLIRGRFSFSISRGIWGLALGGKMYPNMMYLLLKGTT